MHTYLSNKTFDLIQKKDKGISSTPHLLLSQVAIHGFIGNSLILFLAEASQDPNIFGTSDI